VICRELHSQGSVHNALNILIHVFESNNGQQGNFYLAVHLDADPRAGENVPESIEGVAV
jgi:hypothetical protein